jgi:hypothetical protein
MLQIIRLSHTGVGTGIIGKTNVFGIAVGSQRSQKAVYSLSASENMTRGEQRWYHLTWRPKRLTLPMFSKLLMALKDPSSVGVLNLLDGFSLLLILQLLPLPRG